MKVIKSLENRGILFKGTTRKIASQGGGFLNFLRPLMTAGLQLMNGLFTPLAKSVLLPLGLSAGMSAADAATTTTATITTMTAKKSGTWVTALIISNEQMEDITKIAKSFEEWRLLIKGISEAIKNETKEQKGKFRPILFGILDNKSYKSRWRHN